MKSKRHYSVVIIGASQAGLTMAYRLKSAGIDYLMVGKEKRIGDIWRNRYDSLRLFTPQWMNYLPAQKVAPGSDANAYVGRDDIADGLEGYAADHQLNSMLETEVSLLRQQDDEFFLQTNRGNFTASRVVVASGPFQNPFIPEVARQLSPTVFQIHTAHYQNRHQLQDGPILIVGCGNSGAQIAVELAEHHDVHISASKKPTFMPQEVFGKSIFWWFKHLGVYKAHIGTALGKRLSQRGDPVIGKELKTLLRKKRVRLHSRIVGVEGNKVRFDEGSTLKVANVIWATGFVSDYSWLQVPSALTHEGKPKHKRGLCDIPGIYFLGLPWQHNRASALIGGVAADADFLLETIFNEMAAQQKTREESGLFI